MIAGLEKPDAGVVLLAGEDVTACPPQERGVGFVFQHYAAFKHMTVRDNVAFGLKIRKRPKAEIRERVDELLALVHLDGLGRPLPVAALRRPAPAHGARPRARGRAAACCCSTSRSARSTPSVREELRDWLRRLHDEVHVTTIFVTHDQEEAMEVAEQIVVINEGRIEQAGAPDRALRAARRTRSSWASSGRSTELGERVGAPARHRDAARGRARARVEAMVERVARLGFEVRVELALERRHRRVRSSSRARRPRSSSCARARSCSALARLDVFTG